MSKTQTFISLALGIMAVLLALQLVDFHVRIGETFADSLASYFVSVASHYRI